MVNLQPVLFGLLLVAAFLVFSLRVRRLVANLKLGAADARFDRPAERVGRVLRIAFGQSKLLREPLAGILHFCIFWGFVILLAAVLESIGEGLAPGFSSSFLGTLYPGLLFLEDLFGAVVVIVVIVSLARRMFFPPPRLRVEGHSRADAITILSLILLVMVTMFGQNAARIAAEPGAAQNNGHFVSAFLAPLFDGQGGPNAFLYFSVFLWSHVLVVLAFLNYLPSSKHLHVLTSIPNVYFGSLGPTGAIKPINLADETLTKYGATDVTDLTWKQLLDGYTCTECGRCTSVCPANTTGKVLNPKKIVTDVRTRLFEKAGGSPGDGDTNTRQLLDGFISERELWACTTCMACMQECPVTIEHLDTILDLRKGLVLNESRFPEELKVTFSNLERNFTPWGFGHASRGDWAEGLDIPLLSAKQSADYLFWVGCAGSYDARYQSVARAFATLLKKAGVDFAILGNEEKCTGDPARRMGNEYLAQQLITDNIATLGRYGVRKILVTCPHCLQSLSREYRQFGGEYEVTHHTEFLERLIAEGRLVLKPGVERTITFHDPCYLGRYNDVYDAPRDVIDALGGARRVELDRARSRSFCCGAGGGRMWMEETEGRRVNLERTDQALAVHPDIIGTGCPFCMTMLTDGVKERGASESVAVKDIAELVLASLDDGPAPSP
jgi:Fe-S oxidoreductase